MTEFSPKDFSKDALRQTTKANFITSEKIWERGMSMRRDLVSWLAEYGKILNFTLLKPLLDEHETLSRREGFDIEISEDSGGGMRTQSSEKFCRR